MTQLCALSLMQIKTIRAECPTPTSMNADFRERSGEVPK